MVGVHLGWDPREILAISSTRCHILLWDLDKTFQLPFAMRIFRIHPLPLVELLLFPISKDPENLFSYMSIDYFFPSPGVI